MFDRFFNPSRRQKLSYQTLLVGSFALLASTVLGIGDRLTRADITQRRAEDLQSSLAQVVPTTLHDNDLLNESVVVQDENGEAVRVYRALRQNQTTAVAFEVSGPGYGGSTIVLVMGVDPAGNILGVRVIKHAETPGLGDKLELAKSDWILSFNGRSLSNPAPQGWAVKKDGGVFDQFTGATITPRSVVGSVKHGLEFFAAHRAALLNERSPEDPPLSGSPAPQTAPRDTSKRNATVHQEQSS